MYKANINCHHLFQDRSFMLCKPFLKEAEKEAIVKAVKNTANTQLSHLAKKQLPYIDSAVMKNKPYQFTKSVAKYSLAARRISSVYNFDPTWCFNRLSEKIGSKAGDIPLWGQSGKFTILCKGIRFLVFIRNDKLPRYCSFVCIALDTDKPFVSTTGQFGDFINPVIGWTIPEVMHLLMSAALDEKQVFIEKKYSDLLNRTKQQLYPWVDKVEPIQPKTIPNLSFFSQQFRIQEYE